MNNSSWDGSREHVVHGEVGKEYNGLVAEWRGVVGEKRESWEGGEGLKG